MIRRFKFYLKRRNFKKRRLGKFWCERHWKIIEDSLFDPIPIDPSVAAIGITMALYLKDASSAKPTHEACCLVPDHIMKGIFKASRVENFKQWQKNQMSQHGMMTKNVN